VSESAILISNVNIVDVRTGHITENRHVIIDSGIIEKITEIIPNARDYTNTINGTGKYLSPGLTEMHAHIPQPSISNPDIVEETLFLYLSNGITTIRGMLGHPSHLELREQAKNNKILSPRIYTSSPSLNGGSVKTKEEAVTKVTAYKRDGYDFLKIHPGIKLEVFDALVARAKELDIALAGHVPVDVGVRHAMESGFASIDHVDGFLEGLVPQSLNVNPNENGFFGYNFASLANTDEIDELVAISKKNKVWIVPTQSLFERWFAPIKAEELLNQPEMKFMPKSTLDNWKRRKIQSTESGGFDADQWKRFNDIRLKLINRLQKDGHGMLLGSDAPQLFNVPGFSIHHEIEGMKNAGLSNLEILQSGTINPAIYFGDEGSYGEVKESQSADLMLLYTNPLDDLSALKNPSGVMVRGKWLSKKDIDKELNKIAQRNVDR
jgi:hypothetical protein